MRKYDNRFYMNEEGGAGGGGGQSDADSVAAAAAEGATKPDNVPDKFWNAEEKTVNHDAVLTSYTELEGKFGAFTGAPESYEFSISDELKEKGIELDGDSPLIKSFSEMAKESNMSQDMANKLVNMFVEGQHADSINFEENENQRVADELKALGDNAEARIKNIQTWAGANLDAEMVAGLEDATKTAAGVRAVEALIAKSRNSSMVNDDVVDATKDSIAELQTLQFAKDENGNRKMQTDPVYRKMVQEKFALAFPGENRKSIG